MLFCVKKLYVAVLTVLLFAAIFLSFESPVIAATKADIDSKRSQEALSKGGYSLAYPIYLRQAEDGDALAQFSVGLFHQNGWGRPRNEKVACEWFKKAAEGDVPLANHLYGECLDKGIKLAGAPIESIYWYERAAALGHHISWCTIGEKYMNGDGVDVDPKKALSLCEKVAEMGIPKAQVMTGLYYFKPVQGVPNYSKAYSWFESAAKVGNPEGQYYQAIMLQEGLVGDRELEKALVLFDKAAFGGSILSFYRGGALLYEMAADQNEPKEKGATLKSSYLWLSVYYRLSIDQDEKVQAQALLQHLTEMMPPEIIAELDIQIDSYVKKFSVKLAE